MPPAVGRTISVVIPCLDDAVLLRRCLASLAQQQIAPDEVVVVDNGSTDDSAAVALEAGARLVTEPRRGITWATRAGLDAATGDVVARIDADVVVPPDFIVRLHSIWDAADASDGPPRVVAVTGGGRFELPLGSLAARAYLGSYGALTGAALGHPPLFGSNCSLRSQWWREVRSKVDMSDAFVHDDMHLSFAVRPDETILRRRDLVVLMDPRALRGGRQLVVRFRRGFHTVFTNWRSQPPYRRWDERLALARYRRRSGPGRWIQRGAGAGAGSEGDTGFKPPTGRDGNRFGAMIVRPLLARAFWAVSGYRLRSEAAPTSGSAVLIGAPHTSNWDFVFMLAICWRHGMAPKWLGKQSLFKPPFGWVMRALGGVPVDRANPGGLVDEIVARVRSGERFYLVVAPEGTRQRAGRWKSGFYRIARGAGLPLVLGYVDSATRTAGIGPTLELTGDVTADMDRIRAFYADKHGVHPENASPPRLGDEADEPGA